MNGQEIIKLAREAGFSISDDGRSAEQVKRMMTHFAQLVAAAEREEIADNVETYFDSMWAEHNQAAQELAKFIRGRQ